MTKFCQTQVLFLFSFIRHVGTHFEGTAVDSGPGGRRRTPRCICADSGQYNVPLLLWLGTSFLCFTSKLQVLMV
jgi:hypothetical protein